MKYYGKAIIGKICKILESLLIKKVQKVQLSSKAVSVTEITSKWRPRESKTRRCGFKDKMKYGEGGL